MKMRQALHDFQSKIDADLEAVEAGIKDYLRQAEKLFAERNKPASEVRLRMALTCQKGLQEFRSMRNALLARRQLIEGIALN